VLVFSFPSPVVRTDKARRAEIKRQDKTRPTRTQLHKARPDKSRSAFSSGLSASRFACPTRYDDLVSSTDDDDEPSSPVCSQLSMPVDPFSILRIPPPTVSAFRVSYGNNMSLATIVHHCAIKGTSISRSKELLSHDQRNFYLTGTASFLILQHIFRSTK
jgi:hypothetical protein